MATLLDTLKKNLSQVGTLSPVADETGTVQQLLSARKGIVGPQSALGPQGLAIGEIAAAAPAQRELAELSKKAQLQSTALTQEEAAQEQEIAQKQSNLAFQKQQSQLQNRIQTDAILRNLEQGRATLSEEKRRAGLEQAASNLRLQNAMYIDNLQLEGARARLEEGQNFDYQLKQQVMADNIALMKLKIANKEALDMRDAEFQKMLTKIDVNAAIGLANQNIAASAQQAQIQGLGQAATTGIGAYGKYSEAAESGKFDQGYQTYRQQTLARDGKPISYEQYSAILEQGPPKPGTTLGR